jgi:D-arabinose 1-dehydrogenase-like Zn-dependent alcohol dehydrogenase
MGLAVAKGVGFEHVLAVDIDDDKLALARDEYGADLTLNAAADALADRVRSELGGVAGVVDFVGSSASSAQAIELLQGGGVYVSVGLFGGELRIPLPALAVQQLVLRGSFTGTLAELEELIAYVRAGRVKPIPAQPVPFADVNDCFRRLRDGHVSGRLVLTHGG